MWENYHKCGNVSQITFDSGIIKAIWRTGAQRNKISWRLIWIISNIPQAEFLSHPGWNRSSADAHQFSWIIILDKSRNLGACHGFNPIPFSHQGCPVAQMVKNPPAVRETWVWSLGWEDPLEEGLATHPSILAWRIPMDRGAWRAAVPRVVKSQTGLSD